MNKVEIVGTETESGSLFNSALVNSDGHLLVSAVGGGGGTTSTINKAFDGDDGAGTERTVKCSAKGEFITLASGTATGGTTHPLHTTTTGELYTKPFLQHYATQPTIGDGVETTFMADNKGNLHTNDVNLNSASATEGSVSVLRTLTNANLTGSQQGGEHLKHNILCDGQGILFNGLGAYTDLSDLSSFARCMVEANYGSLFVRSKNSTIGASVDGSISWVDAVIGGQTNSPVLDCIDTTTLRIWGDTTTADPIVLEFANINPNFVKVEEITPILVNGSYTINKYYNLSPNYIRFFNMGTAGINTTFRLYVEQGHD